MLKLLVIEDHALVREGLLQALKSLDDEVVTLGAADAEAGLEILATNEDVDLILLDLMLPGTSGMALLGVLRKRFPAMPVAVLSALDDPDTVARAMRHGAAGFIPKASSTAIMIQALRDILAGEVWLPPRLRDPAARGSGRGRDAAERFGLTPAQVRVLELLVQGKTNREIAKLLDVTEGTVKIHVSAIFKAMNVTNRSQALLAASKNRVKV
ncbi:MAG: response regulator transcription factor [Gammaproteobacteria bacterium]|nr:response regulator transcription factor [Gammaproteobacteria bacterium]MBU1415498.1 response regulator transcription factor [Gammaproteobacteria bacterium]